MKDDNGHDWSVDATEHPFLTGWKCRWCSRTCVTQDGMNPADTPKHAQPCVNQVRWRDAFGRRIDIGTRVAYPRTPRNGGGMVYAVGTVTGPARLSGDRFVSIDLTKATKALLGTARGRVPSVSVLSLIIVNDDVDNGV